jgi:hypothetical protein
MKIIKGIGIGLAIIASAIHANAIEHLEISVQCTNVVLRWPCLDDGSEQFIVQYRSTLSSTDSWQTLETFLPATYGTNEMYYTNWGVVKTPVNCNGGGSFSMMMMQGGEEEMLSSTPAEPMATPNGAADAVPVKLYPDGFDFSNFTISVPGTEGSLSGANFMQAEAESPLDPSGGGASGDGDTNSIPPDFGFYQVVRVGPHLMGITNGQILSGIVQIPVEVGYYTGQLQNVTLTENNTPVDSASIHPAPFELPLPFMTLDTTRLTNGVHQIAAIAQWDTSTGTNESDGGMAEYDCPPITVTISNEISFPSWQDNFGDLYSSVLISAVSAHTNIDYYIDIYGANAGYIGTLGGHSDDGNIYGYWDLTGPPPDNIVYTNEPWFQFEISTPYIDPPSPKTYKQNDPWPGKGAWVIACQHAFDYLSGHEDLYGEVDPYVGLAGAAGANVYPPPNSGVAYALHFGDDAGADTSWNTFKQAVTNSLSRNMVYFGHGDPAGLGQNLKNPIRSLLAKDIATMLHTIPVGQTNRHPYRMVILDGCSTASGTLPESFGIQHKENVPSADYANAGVRMQSFCGWSADKYIGFLNGGALNYDHIHFITWINYYLAQGQTIKQAVQHASTMPDVVFLSTGEFKIFGCWDLTWGAQNQ